MGRRESRREGGEEDGGRRAKGGKEDRNAFPTLYRPSASNCSLQNRPQHQPWLSHSQQVFVSQMLNGDTFWGDQKPVLFTYQTAVDTCCRKRRQGPRAPLKVPGGCLRSPCCSPYKVRDLEGHPHSRDSFRNVHGTLWDRPGW